MPALIALARVAIVMIEESAGNSIYPDLRSYMTIKH
jgi:hypothetical protein